MKRDRFAISTYPYAIEYYNGSTFVWSSPYHIDMFRKYRFDSRRSVLPWDYFTRAAAIGGERLIIAETGWNSQPMLLNADTSQSKNCFY